MVVANFRRRDVLQSWQMTAPAVYDSGQPRER
jgi:hypothetical protein